MSSMKKAFIDANAFIYFLSDIKEKAEHVQKILEDENYELYTSYAVLNEVKFRLLINKAIEELKTTKKHRLIKFISDNENIRISIIEKYIKFFINIASFVTILDMNEMTEKATCSIIIKNGLLPTDASIVALMMSNNIKKILTSDSDFKKIKGIEVIVI